MIIDEGLDNNRGLVGSLNENIDKHGEELNGVRRAEGVELCCAAGEGVVFFSKRMGRQ